MMRIDSPFVSVILPIRNEGQHIERCLLSVLCQDYPHERMEVFLVDGMSNDNTRLLARHCLAVSTMIVCKILDNPQRNISDALNLGIRAAHGAVIVRVDGHTILAQDYVARCVRALRETGADNVGGPMRAVGETAMGRAIALATSSPFGVGNARFHYAVQAGWVDTVYMGAYPRSVFEKIGLFDAELVRNQDDEFNFRLIQSGGKIWLDPEIVSTYYARASLPALARQYFAYGFWKVRVIQKHGRPASLRHLVPVTFITVLMAAALLSIILSSLAPLGLVLLPYLFAAFAVAFSIARTTRWIYLALVPLAFATMHFSYGFGFLAGMFRFAPRPFALFAETHD
jgi:succinoglycan biosynthesis protein ExoA